MQKQSFNSSWRFFIDNSGSLWQTPSDSDGREVDLPHDWSPELPRGADQPSGSSGGFFANGSAWYTKTFDAPVTWKGKIVFVEFEGVYMNAEIWLNENFLGRHPYGYTTFQVDLTPFLKVGEANVLKVRVDNGAQLNSRWYSGAGIYRPVWLMVAEPVHVAHWGVSITTPSVSEAAAAVHIQTTLVNESSKAQDVTLRTYIKGPDGLVLGTLEKHLTLEAGNHVDTAQNIHIPHPRLWSPDTPDLYQVETSLLAGDKQLDSAFTPFGIRSLSFSSETGFLLNGKPLKLKGGCVHHDNGVLGAASYPRAEERKVEVLKASGFNAIRTAHNPPAPAMLDACDRLGMLVMDEAFDCWRTGKNPYDYHVVFDDWWQRDIDSMLLRDRNHPSIILWSIGNEVLERDGRSDGAAIARRLAERVRNIDPTRPVTSAICGVWDKNRAWTDTDEIFESLAVGGYNYQWQQYEPDHARHPQRMMIGTESFPIEAFENWQAVLDHSYVLGDFVWTSLDYLGESGIGRVHFDETLKDFLGKFPWHQANCGDLDICGFKRPQSYYRDVVWTPGAKQYIAVHPPVAEGKTPKITQWGWPDVWPNWNYAGREGQRFHIEVYSPCDEVELFLNDHSLGRKPAGKANKFIASFEVHYQPGELKAIGYNQGKKAQECLLSTTGPADQLRLTPDRDALRAEPGDLSYVMVEIVDSDGRLLPDADRLVTFSLKGPGEIAAVGSADPLSEESYRGNARTPFRGRALVIIKAEGKKGVLRLKAEAEGLKAMEVGIRVG
jgi:beta-galactosidase